MSHASVSHEVGGHCRDAEGLYNLPEGQQYHAKPTIALPCSLAYVKDVNGLMVNFTVFPDALAEPGAMWETTLPS